jgi:allantoin racemase
MRLHVVNPNTTEAMTAKIATAARAVALLDTVIDARQPEMGPVSIEGFYDEAFAVPGMLGCIRDADRDGADAHIIACFDDTGLDAARAIAQAPVIGIAEAAFHTASLIAGRFAVVTTLSVFIVPIENNLRKYGLSDRCARVRAADVPGTGAGGAIKTPAPKSATKLVPLSALIARRPSCSGCAGMVDLVAELAHKHGLPVVDGVTAAVTLAEALVRLGLKTSRLGLIRRQSRSPIPACWLDFGLELPQERASAAMAD